MHVAAEYAGQAGQRRLVAEHAVLEPQVARAVLAGLALVVVPDGGRKDAAAVGAGCSEPHAVIAEDVSVCP